MNQRVAEQFVQYQPDGHSNPRFDGNIAWLHDRSDRYSG